MDRHFKVDTKITFLWLCISEKMMVKTLDFFSMHTWLEIGLVFSAHDAHQIIYVNT